MATIQVREIPEDLCEVLRRRARRAGQSFQAYMREQVVALAQRPTNDEAVARIEAITTSGRIAELPIAAIVEDVGAERR